MPGRLDGETMAKAQGIDRVQAPEDALAVLAASIIAQAKVDAEYLYVQTHKHKGKRNNSNKSTNRFLDLSRTRDPIKFLIEANSAAHAYLDARGVETHDAQKWARKFKEQHCNAD